MRREGLWRAVLALAVFAAAVSLYRWSGLWEANDSVRALLAGNWAALIIILAMGAAWAFALPASAFLFITPLLFAPHWSALITTTGCALGTAIKSYVYATALHSVAGAGSLMEALSARTLLSLFGVALLALGGHVLGRRYLRSAEAAAAR